MSIRRGLNYVQEVYRSCTHLLTQFHVHKKSECKENNKWWYRKSLLQSRVYILRRWILNFPKAESLLENLCVHPELLLYYFNHNHFYAIFYHIYWTEHNLWLLISTYRINFDIFVNLGFQPYTWREIVLRNLHNHYFMSYLPHDGFTLGRNMLH